MKRLEENELINYLRAIGMEEEGILRELVFHSDAHHDATVLAVLAS